MTSDELTGLERLADAATPGQWRSTGGESSNVQIAGLTDEDVVISGCGCCGSPYTNNEADPAFIAAARTAVPALVAEVRRLRALVEEAYREGIAEYADEYFGGGYTSYARRVAEIERATTAEWEKSDARKALDGGA